MLKCSCNPKWCECGLLAHTHTHKTERIFIVTFGSKAIFYDDSNAIEFLHNQYQYGIPLHKGPHKSNDTFYCYEIWNSNFMIHNAQLAEKNCHFKCFHLSVDWLERNQYFGHLKQYEILFLNPGSVWSNKNSSFDYQHFCRNFIHFEMINSNEVTSDYHFYWQCTEFYSFNKWILKLLSHFSSCDAKEIFARNVVISLSRS